MNMELKLNPILPNPITNDYKGYSIARIMFLIIAIITIARSLIHIFLPDGGASVIAGIDTTGEGGNNIIALFALWGLSQLLLGLVFIIVYLRYKSLIGFCYILILLEYTGRIGLGFIKVLESSYTPPGVIGNYIMIPLAAIMLILCLKIRK
jgi:hypothetical protein